VTERSLAPVGLLADAFRLAWAERRRVVLYGLAAGAILAVLLAPLASWLLMQGLEAARGGTVLNYELADLASSPAGLLLGLLWVLLAAVLGVVAFSGHVLLLDAGRRGSPLPWKTLARRVGGILPRIAGVGVARLGLWVAVLVPAAHGALWALVALALLPFGSLPIPDLARQAIDAAPVLVPVVLGLGLLGFWLFLRWCLTVPVLALEGVRIGPALGASAALVRGQYRPLAVATLLHVGTSALLVSAVTAAVGALDKVLLGLVTGDEGPRLGWLALVLVLDTLLLSVVGAFETARAAALLTLAHARLRGDDAPRAADAGEESDEASPRAKRSLIAALAIVAVGLGVAAWATVPFVEGEMTRIGRSVAVTAHRGSSGEAPENTLASVRLAIEDGADWAEVDFLEAKDGTVVLLHDVNLKRVAGVDKNVWEMTGDELRALDVGAWFGPRFAGERIATLDEVIEVARGKIELNLEIKVHGREQRLAETLVETVRRLDFVEHCVVTSLDAAVLATVRRLAPEIKIGMIITAKVGKASDLDVDLYSTQPLVATVAFIRRAHREGREVHVWTVNEEKEIRAAIDSGADNLITDWPKRARAVLDARTPFEDLAAAVRRLFRR
jgi:glycerophosphoryl diester phosphodiesterase